MHKQYYLLIKNNKAQRKQNKTLQRYPKSVAFRLFLELFLISSHLWQFEVPDHQTPKNKGMLFMFTLFTICVLSLQSWSCSHTKHRDTCLDLRGPESDSYMKKK